MKSFFSIISITTNNHSSESIAVGLIMVSDKVYFEYSTSKLNWIKNLYLGEDTFYLVQSSLKKIKNIIKKENTNNSYKLIGDLFSMEYFSYLNQYSGGVFSFSSPVMLPIEINKKEFESYYMKMIGEAIPQKTVKVKSFQQKIKSLYKTKQVKEFADINFKMNPSCFSGILKPTTLSMITKNGAVQALQTIDFSQSENSVIGNLYESQIIENSLNDFCNQHNLKVDKLKIAFEIPKNIQDKKLFNKAYKANKGNFQFLDLSEVEDFINKAKISESYIPFSTLFS